MEGFDLCSLLGDGLAELCFSCDVCLLSRCDRDGSALDWACVFSGSGSIFSGCWGCVVGVGKGHDGEDDDGESAAYDEEAFLSVFRAFRGGGGRGCLRGAKKKKKGVI